VSGQSFAAERELAAALIAIARSGRDQAALVSDQESDCDAKEHFREFLTPRLGLDGELYWPINEFGEAEQ
jgi:hypothetical protein